MLTKKEPLKNEIKTPKTLKNSSLPQTNAPSDTCCSSKASTTQQSGKTATQPPSSHTKNPETHTEKKHPIHTRLTIKYDAGFPNQIFIRGKGANLNWEKGQPLKNTKADEWVWETDYSFTQCEFKVLINDSTYELGDNHLLNNGASLIYTPHF